jgi:NADH-quinone oxidoreductase subunit J
MAIDSMTINIILLVLLVVSAVATVMSARLLRSVIGLAIASAIVAILMYQLNSPLAAVFELSVCAGLIPAIFISTIGLTGRLSPEALAVRRREKLKRFWFLPLLIVLVGAALTQVHFALPAVLPPAIAGSDDARNVLWNMRHLDLVGQIVILLGGAFGVVVLLKEVKHG